MQWNLLMLVLMGECCLMVCQLYEYYYINERKNWTEAQQYCREKHTDLATVTNMKDTRRLISNPTADMSEAWIGLYAPAEVNRTWYWSLPGVEFSESETNWKSGEPNDVEIENCGIILKTLKWIDMSCKNKFPFLCYNESKTSEKFYLIEEKKTWLEAQSYCRKHHTDFICGINQDYQLKNLINNTEHMFIGLFRDTWRWSDGSSLSFRHWKETFDDEQYNSGRCAMTVFQGEYRWENKECQEKKTFICYDDKVILIKEKMNWEDALYYCRDHHHDLVTITNLDEQRWVQEKAKSASTDYVWMGLRYTCTLDFWFWVSDDVVSYKNWASDGPMDDCDMSGAMETRGEHKWFKRNDNEIFNFVCSKP